MTEHTANAAQSGGVFFPTVTNAFEHRSHARCACYFFIFAFCSKLQ
jgi:hypothetical protein